MNVVSAGKIPVQGHVFRVTELRIERGFLDTLLGVFIVAGALDSLSSSCRLLQSTFYHSGKPPSVTKAERCVIALME